MGHSGRIRLTEIRRVHELLEQISGLGVDPAAWRSHMLEQLCLLTGARVGITTDIQNGLPGQLMQTIEPLAVGFETTELRRYCDYLASDDRLVDPGSKAMQDHHLQRRFYTHSRQQMIDANDWYGSPVVSEGRRSVNIDHYLVSSYSLSQPGWWTGFALYRNWGDTPFTDRERRLVRLFHAGLLRRLRRRDPASETLPVYLQQMLRSLLQGHTAQESADALCLSLHTVRSYTKEIYSRLGISSRGALVARFYHQKSPPPIFLPAAFDSGY